jgi:hypothetical protein
MAETRDAAPVRMAELLASLSLGIDLGFGQPMEHVLRQCLIALRLGEQIGLDESDRATVYYTALLVNVGCHSDAHEQARWFGDDIAMKSTKYEYEPFTVADAVAMVRLIGSGGTPLHRFRTGLEFAVGGYKEVNHMIEYHAALARELGVQLGLPDDVLDALGASYERWDGRGWPGKLSADEIPMASRVSPSSSRSRIASAGPTPRSRWPRNGARRSSIRCSSTHSCSTRRRSSVISTTLRRGTR